MGTFSITDMLSNKTKTEALQIPSGHLRTEDISIKRMYRNKENRYNLYNIEELASNIQAVGLRQNLEVIYDPCEDGDYRILSGERRWLALNQLVEEGYKEYEIVTCKVCCPASANMEKLELMATNSYREKNNADLMMEVKEATETFRRLKEEGAKVPGYDLQSGRIRDIVASFLGLSRTKVAQIESINNNLIEILKTPLRSGKIPFSVAYEVAGLDTKLQVKAVRRYYENDKLSLKDVKEIKQQWEEKNIPGQIEMDIQPDQTEEKEEKITIRMPTFTRMEDPEEVKTETKETKEDIGAVEEQEQCVKTESDEPDSAEKNAEVPNKTIPDTKSDSEDEEYTVSKPIEIEGKFGTWYKPDEYIPHLGVPILIAIEYYSKGKAEIQIHEGEREKSDYWTHPVKTAEGGYVKCWGMDEDIFAWMRMPEYKEE